jgi:hypothetical protein
MADQSNTTDASTATSQSSEISRTAIEGITAGIIGAATIAIWFFILDVSSGRPFYTPNLLGNVLLRRAVSLESIDAEAISIEMVLIYTWAHALAFCVIGGIAAKLLSLAEKNTNYGFGILLLFVIFEFGFVAVALIFAEPILHALTWPAILVGNLLAAGAMAVYFWRHHPKLVIAP